MEDGEGPSVGGGERMRAYRWNPSPQRIIVFKFFPIVGFEDKFSVTLRETDSWVGIKLFNI